MTGRTAGTAFARPKASSAAIESKPASRSKCLCCTGISGKSPRACLASPSRGAREQDAGLLEELAHGADEQRGGRLLVGRGELAAGVHAGVQRGDGRLAAGRERARAGRAVLPVEDAAGEDVGPRRETGPLRP